MRLISMGLVFALLGLGGCALPAAGPTVNDLEYRPLKGITRASHHDTRYVLVKVTKDVVPILKRHHYRSWPASFRSLSYTPSIRLKPGDVVAVSIYESGGSSLFAPPSTDTSNTSVAGQTSTVPPQTIEPNGRIIVPFVGPIRVAGLPPQIAAQRIAERLSSQAVNPQVVVSLVSNGANSASVSGEVNKAGLIPLTLRGERILDAVALAGGSKYPTSEVDVRLIRGNTRGSVPLSHILADPSQNVIVRPNDNLVVVRNPRTFVVMGASQKVAQYTFDTSSVTLAEAVARGGGIIDTVGDPSGIYIFRKEPEARARQIIELSGEHALDPETREPVHLSDIHGPVHMIYNVDLKTADGYFKSQEIALRNKDIVLVSNAKGTQLLKALAVIRGFTGVGFDIGNIIKD